MARGVSIRLASEACLTLKCYYHTTLQIVAHLEREEWVSMDARGTRGQLSGLYMPDEHHTVQPICFFVRQWHLTIDSLSYQPNR